MENIFSVGIGYGIVIYGLMFRDGWFSGKKNDRYRKIFSFDDVFFPGLDEKKGEKADTICFRVSVLMGILLALNGVLSAFFRAIPNIGMIFIVVSFPGLMIFRFIYLFFKK
ncbi:MAG: hypothetical protein IPN65_03360 [Elusimicrobia bacterium]|nr:hypothetical protein [Elusimicrobiota bacterium]MBK8127161.1 hypothetical protein [Elusimicrobiota bacterium]MBK9058302.1 hypothetical protein [Elusimicrobiota bacterium]MBK9429527.1 hypothetical protein [Elusimicrobiota bacterium]MBL0251067.1 hypothetical protein [Elusimicrobiota bacterium]